MATAPTPSRSHPPQHVEDSVQINVAYLLPICLVATLGGLLFGYDTGVISGAIEALKAHFGLKVEMEGKAMEGLTTGCALLGCAVGVLMVGPLSDRFGRKLAMFLAAALFLVSALGTALPKSITIFIVFRFLGGLGIGIASISTPMYIAEITPAKFRGRMVSLNQIAIVLGFVATALINFYLTRLKGDPALPAVQAWLTETGWRWMFAIGAVPSVLFGLLLFTLPESPRWLIERGRDAEAASVLEKVGGSRFAARESQAIRSSLSAEQGTWAEVFSRKLRRPLLLGISLAILQQVTGINVLMYYGASIFKNLSASTGVDKGLWEQIIMNGTGLVFTLIAILTVDRFGRKPLMLVGAAGMGACLVAMGLTTQSLTDPATSHAGSGWMLLHMVLYIASFGLSVGPVVWVILSEIFPTAVRGRAMGLATFFLWLADYAVIQTYPMMNAKGSWLMQQFHQAFPYYLYAFFCAVLWLLVWKLVPETKGKSLEQIEKEWIPR